ncbi:MAG: hypothetical protein IPP26_12475 [Flavobacteriales bacterium]|nr:hypothetical protein [Flavobacteriales bacterium]
MDIAFTGEAAQTPDAVAYQMKDYVQNFYLPWCGPNGVTNVHGYNRVVYENIYPFIDFHVYSGRSGQKIAFVVRPGGNPEDLQLLLNGQNQLSLDFWGNLKILLANKWIVLPQAVAYQVDGNNNVEMLNWTADYVPNNNTGVVGFTFDAYDSNRPLVLLIGAVAIDPPAFTPGVCYSTYFGGNGYDLITANTIDMGGNHYVTGNTYSSFTNFPGTVGNNIFMGYPSLFACRMDNMDHVVWKDFFGGSGAGQIAWGIDVRNGSDPKVYVGGWTACTNFYCLNGNPGNDYFDASGSGYNNGFIVRLDHDLGILEHATYFGNETVLIQDITIDPLGRLIVVGQTTGILPLHQVPLPAGAEQWGFGGDEDGFIAMFDLSDRVLWSTPFGGTFLDRATTVRARGNTIGVVGSSSSTTFPQALNGGGNQNSSTPAGFSDIMIIEFNQNGDEQWGTLFGGNDIEDPGYHGLDIDPVTGDIYIVGYTRSSNLPLLYTTDWHDATPPSGNANGFIAEFSSTRNRKWITYVSNSGTGGLDAVRVGQDRSVFIAGYAHAGFQTQPMGGLYESNAPLGDQDGVIMRFDTDHNYLWGTYFGGDTPGTIDKVYSIALRGTERLYTCGKTNSPNGPNDFFPLSDELIPGSWFNPNFQPGTDGFVAAFCIAPTAVGLPNFEATGGSSLLAWVDDGGWWSVMGGTPGLQPLFICDAAGRVVQHAQMRVPSDTPLRFNTASLSPGAYVLRIGERSAKVLVVQH